MSRGPRRRDPSCIYHIVVKGISEVKLFKKPKEKEKYLELVAKYRDTFKFTLYGFCIMDTHAHLIIGSNGADISKFMQGINGCYVSYFNVVHDREGHALKDRFWSSIIAEDSYLLNVSLYVHRNPKKIKEYADKIDKYKYSTLVEYIDENFKYNGFVPVDTTLILSLMHSDKAKARDLYFRRVLGIDKSPEKAPSPLEEKFIENQKIEYEYKSGKRKIFRNVDPATVIEYVAKALNLMPFEIKVKFKRIPSKLRALSVLFLRCFCDLKLSEIGEIIGNITTSEVGYLCDKGYRLIKKEYYDIMEKFLEEFSSSWER